MTPLQINMAITKSLGTHTVVLGQRPDLNIPIYRVTDRNGRFADIWEDGSSSDLEFEWPVRYCSSLGAMWALEETLATSERSEYRDILACVSLTALRFGGCEALDQFDMLHASALDRATSYCHLKGLWKDKVANPL